MRRVFINAKILVDNHFVEGAIIVDNGYIVAIGGDVDMLSTEEVVDVRGRYITLGLVDVHVHLREPGFEYKETIESGTTAAARGGYTTICSMPNLTPAPDGVAGVGVQLERIEKYAKIRVIPYGCITKGQKGCGELVDFESIKGSVVGFSDDGRGVQSDELMDEAMRRIAKTGRAVVAHCEIDDLLRGGYIHDGEYCKANGHRGICSQSEWGQVKRDIELAEKNGCQYHVCHVSTKESVELVRQAKSRGARVSCETAPHYLLLCDEDLKDEGRFKMNPPLRSSDDRAALIEGIIDGTIEVIATDHAPHLEQEKSRGLENSAMGVVGIETAFGLLYKHLVKSEVITLNRLIELMSYNPRRLFNIGGEMKSGAVADFTIFDLDSEYIVDPKEFVSKGGSTPFEGWSAQGYAVMTIVGGEIVYKRE